MSENSNIHTTRDLYVEARKMSVNVQQLAGNTTTLRITWTLPPTPWQAYAGAIVLLSESQIPSDASIEDGKKYLASSNWAAPADTVSGANVVAAFYGYFGDNLATTVSVDVTNTDPTNCTTPRSILARTSFNTTHQVFNPIRLIARYLRRVPMHTLVRFHKQSNHQLTQRMVNLLRSCLK
jgi:hypothetical protein